MQVQPLTYTPPSCTPTLADIDAPSATPSSVSFAEQPAWMRGCSEWIGTRSIEASTAGRTPHLSRIHTSAAPRAAELLAHEHKSLVQKPLSQILLSSRYSLPDVLLPSQTFSSPKSRSSLPHILGMVRPLYLSTTTRVFAGSCDRSALPGAHRPSSTQKRTKQHPRIY